MSAILPPNATQLNELLNRGYDLLDSGSHAAACDTWLQAWELLKQLATPNIRTCDGFDHAMSHRAFHQQLVQ